jgi:hypothetical protein
LAVAFADLCRNYLRDSCPGFDRIVLYASIFSEEGEKLARFYKFRIHKDKEERSGVAKDKHDVRMLELRADDKKSVRSAGGHFVIHMDW